MLSGKRTPKRIENYLKYNSSSIFDDISSSEHQPTPFQKENPSNNITPKPTENKLDLPPFEPKYNNITPFQRYLNQFWNEQAASHKRSHTVNGVRNSRSNHRSLFEDKRKNDDECVYPTTPHQRYISEFFGDEHIKDVDSRCSLRSKSVFTNRPYQRELFSDEQEEEKNETSTPYTHTRKLRTLDLCSDIFHTKTLNQHQQQQQQHHSRNSQLHSYHSFRKEEEKNNSFTIDEILFPDKPRKSSLAPSEITSSTSSRHSINVYPTTSKDKMKNMFPSNFDWINNNTELSSKTHIHRSRNSTNNDLIHYKAPSFTHATSTHEVTQDYYCKFPRKRMNNEKESNVYIYEMKGPKRFIEDLGDNTVKKLFLEKGIHIYNYQNNSVFNDNDQDKITFQIRTNENERDLQKKLKRIRNEINSFGVDFKRIYVNNTTRYPKKRKATPGTVLKNEKRVVKE